jgi:LacI family transcriptional regulator
MPLAVDGSISNESYKKAQMSLTNPRSVIKPSRRVAVLVDTSTSWGRRIIEGLHQYESEHSRWQLFVEPRGVEQRRWLPPGWTGDGVIARVGFPELADQLQKLGLPVVNVSGIELPGVDFPRVITNQREAARMAADHFLNSGFRHFGYFSLLGLDYVAEHQQTFRAIAEAEGCDCSLYAAASLLGAAESDWMLDLDRLVEWLESLPKPVAILTWNTGSARELLYACAAAGMKVPEEVSVMSGSDDDLFCKVAPVPISAVNPAAEEIGFRAAERLDQLMNRKRASGRKDILIPPLGVVTRQSTETLAVEDPSLVKALRYIREDPARAMRVGDVAAHAGLCRRALEQRFLRILGRSPASEIRRVRIERAIDLLQRTKLPVSVVAEKSGFSTAEYMASVFRSQLDAAPMSFRKRE